MKIISSNNNKVEVGSLLESSFSTLLKEKYAQRKKIIITDENTHALCLPYLIGNFDALANAEIMVLPAGEENKSIEICIQITEALSEYGVQRQDVIINLGGGLTTDMGGFIASIYRRGIDFINIPTSLLAMVDASVGGKTGVNLGGLKNQLGTFSLPVLTVCSTVFLETLADIEIRSGRAEMLKHGLIASGAFFKELTNQPALPTDDQIFKAIQIKATIVDADFKETGERKKLNFGHTVGHALESFLLTKNQPATHGECVAWGMLVEAYLSTVFHTLTNTDFSFIEKVIANEFQPLSIQKKDFNTLINLMHHDKKNQNERLNFTLLSSIGKAEIDFLLADEEVYQALAKVW